MYIIKIVEQIRSLFFRGFSATTTRFNLIVIYLLPLHQQFLDRDMVRAKVYTERSHSTTIIQYVASVYSTTNPNPNPLKSCIA